MRLSLTAVEHTKHYNTQKSKLLACVCVTVTSPCKMNPTSNPTAQQAPLAKALQCQQALPKPSPTHTHAHTSSDAFLVTLPQGPVLCPKILIPSRKQAPLKPQNNGRTKLSYNYKPPPSAKGRSEVQGSNSSK